MSTDDDLGAAFGSDPREVVPDDKRRLQLAAQLASDEDNRPDLRRRCALDLLEHLVSAVDQHDQSTWHGPIQWECAKFIADAFEKIIRAHMRADGPSATDREGGTKWADFDSAPAEMDANKALALKRPLGRPRGGRTHDTQGLAAAYFLLRRRERRAEEAREQICRGIPGLNDSTIEDAAKEFSYFEQLPDAVLTNFLAPTYGEVIRRILTGDSER